VGIGPGGPLNRTRRAEEVISQSRVVVGYKPYLKSIEDLTEGKEVISSGMTQEVERCRTAMLRAREGDIVALISSGDPGVYGMAGLAIEMASAEGMTVPIEIIPGISSANAAGARLGAPLMLDYATISLSDLLIPWETIRSRLEAVASADLVVAIYNPRSKRRTRQLREAAAIFRSYRPGTTPVGIATDLDTEGERILLSDLDHFLEFEVNMRSIILIGNRSSKCVDGWFVTPRGYKL